jgi:hypothetical protein
MKSWVQTPVPPKSKQQQQQRTRMLGAIGISCSSSAAFWVVASCKNDTILAYGMGISCTCFYIIYKRIIFAPVLWHVFSFTQHQFVRFIPMLLHVGVAPSFLSMDNIVFHEVICLFCWQEQNGCFSVWGSLQMLLLKPFTYSARKRAFLLATQS